MASFLTVHADEEKEASKEVWGNTVLFCPSIKADRQTKRIKEELSNPEQQCMTRLGLSEASPAKAPHCNNSISSKADQISPGSGCHEAIHPHLNIGSLLISKLQEEQATREMASPHRSERQEAILYGPSVAAYTVTPWVIHPLACHFQIDIKFYSSAIL